MVRRARGALAWAGRPGTTGLRAQKSRLQRTGVFVYWRRGRDSNPRYGVTVYTLSRRAPSTTRTPLQKTCSFTAPFAAGDLPTTEHAACSLLGLSLPSPFRGRLAPSKIAPGDFVNHSDTSPENLFVYRSIRSRGLPTTEHAACSLLGLSLPSPLRGRLVPSKFTRVSQRTSEVG